MAKKQSLGLVPVVVLAIFTTMAGCHKNDGTQEVDAAAANGNLAPVSDTGGATPVNESVAPAPATPLPIRLRPARRHRYRSIPSKRNSRSILPRSSNTRTNRRTRISSIKARSTVISRTRRTTRRPNMLLNLRLPYRNTNNRRAPNQTICGRLAIGRMRRPVITGFLEFGSRLPTRARCGHPDTGAMMPDAMDGIAAFGAATSATMAVSITAAAMLDAATTAVIGITTNSTTTVGSRT